LHSQLKKGSFQRKRSEKKTQKKQINFGDKIKTTTFALPIKKGAKSKVKSSLKVWKQQQIIN
jgi:hypothetical protein